MNRNHYLVILSGGTGPRLWPLSRADRPKQFLNLLSKNNFLQNTYLRCLANAPIDRIFVVSNQKFSSKIKDALPSLPDSNLILEPDKKNTTPAIVLASAIINSVDPNAIITTIPSDHYFAKNKDFNKLIKSSFQVVSKTNKICLIGKKPKYSNPSYGYILPSKKYPGFTQVANFIEKPKATELSKLIKENAHWNLGIYTFLPQILFSELKKYQKKEFPIYDLIINHPNDPTTIKRAFNQLTPTAIDYSISENSKELVFIPTTIAWSDIGEWNSIHLLSKKDRSQISTINKDQLFYQINSKNCLIHSHSSKLIGLVGVENLAIIDTANGLLVCRLEDSLQVRDLVGKIVTKSNTKNYFLESP